MNKIIKNAFLFILIALFLAQCATFRTIKLERKLSPDLRDWYGLHRILMEEEVPAWIEEKSPSERLHFLNLPPEMQRKYIALFWRIRAGGAKELFYGRVEDANQNFNEGIDGWKTDRGQIVLLCGLPDYAYGIQGIENEWPAHPKDIYDYTHLVWIYMFRNQLVYYAFEFSPPFKWRLSYNSIVSFSTQAELERFWRRIFAPTEEGWDLWGNVLLAWVKENEK